MSPTSAATHTLFVCHGTGCVSGGSPKIHARLEEEMKRLGIAQEVNIKLVGCHGFCQQGPIVDVDPEGYFYTEVKVEDAPDIARSLLPEGKPVERLFYHDPVSDKIIPRYQDVPFYQKQQRLILRDCGHINPEDISDYLSVGGYQAVKKALFQMTPEQVIEEVKLSGIRGRGGAGFPTGQKWEFCRKSSGTEKYLICNADEGDPGAFMDRSILEAVPHRLLEGMIIAAYAMGCTSGYIYVRAEYPLAVRRLYTALRQGQERGLLGKNIMESSFSFDIQIKEGAGAFVCGEETALMASIEGRRGMPRPRPPFPAQAGLWGKPTNINNVKTLSSIPWIILQGGQWYSSVGTEKSKGTAVFALTGKIANSGLVEVPMGTPLRDIIFEIGGGISSNKRFKAVQTGGPSGGCLPANMLDSPVDYESLTQAGSIMGSGGMVVVDEDTCMVDLAKFFLSFTQTESCGKCVPCRVGTRQMLTILERITRGEGEPGDIDRLLKMGEMVKATSLCGLGGTAPNPVLTTIRYFREEYEEHIKKHHCRAVVCKGLVRAPCTHACPAGMDAARYVRLISQGKFAEALAVVRETAPFPAVLGRVCFHPCELKCRRGQLEESISIRALKRAAAQYGGQMWKERSSQKPSTGKKVAIVGSGPAGLTAAYYLAKQGHSVTVFEALPELGGMMRVGIPEYRLPRQVLETEIEEIKQAGVSMKTNSTVQSLDELTSQGYNAVFLAMGAHQGMKMGVPGEDNPRVKECVAFLRDVNLGRKVKIGERVGVVGGGNAAIDAARVALRLGATSVTIIYRRTQTEMPASPEEVAEALHEGANILFLVAPSKIAQDNSHLKMECLRMSLGKVDATGRRRPEPIRGSEFVMEFDSIIAAVGQTPEVPSQLGLSLERGNIIKVDPETLATSRSGVFAGGDVVTGPASVIEAIAQGREAAKSIDRHLGGAGVIAEALAPLDDLFTLPPIQEGEKYRPKLPVLSREERLKGFAEVEQGYTPELAIAESHRCLRCDLEVRE